MQSNIQFPPAVMPGCHVDSGLFSEQHGKGFIIHFIIYVIKSTRCVNGFYLERFFVFVQQMCAWWMHWTYIRTDILNSIFVYETQNAAMESYGQFSLDLAI